jgi:uncharacterized protein with GYD domain
MRHYLLQASYTAEAWARLVKKPQNRQRVVQAAVEKLGGRVEGVWLAFGEQDVVVLCQMPDDVSAAAFAMAALAGGALKSIKTTPLLTTEEGLEAAKKAAQSGYQPPK